MSDSINRFKLWFYSQPRALRALLAVNVVVYLLWQLVFIHFEATQGFFLRHLALNPNVQTIIFEPWQLITYAFLHLDPGLGGLLHILFNMLWIVWIGKDYEALYGPGRLLGIYLLGSAGAALLTVLLHFLFPGVAVFGGIVHGASGAVLATMTMVGIHHPEQRIGLMFIGVVRLIHVVLGFIALDILFLSGGGTSISAHWGGVLTGYLCGVLVLKGANPTSWADVVFKTSVPGKDARHRSSGSGYGGGSGHGGGQGIKGAAGEHRPKGSFLHRMEWWLANKPGKPKGNKSTNQAKIYRMDVAAPASDSSDESDVDRILDKISASGYDSLSKKEKENLLRESGKNN